MSAKLPGDRPESLPPAGEGAAPPSSGPTDEDRKRLLYAIQVQALNEPNPLAAGLGMVSGDLFGLANGMQPTLAELLSSPARATSKATGQFADLYMRFVGRFTRCAELQVRIGEKQKESKP